MAVRLTASLVVVVALSTATSGAAAPAAFTPSGVSAPSAAPRPRVGDVVVADRLGQRDTVTFYFPPDAKGAVDTVRRTAASARVPVHDLYVVDDTGDGLLHVLLITTVGRRTGLLARRIDAATLEGLDIFGRGRVVLSLHPAARVETRPPLVDHDVLARRFEVTTTETVDYRVPPSWLLRALAVLLVIAVLPATLTWAWSSRVERRSEDDVDKVHRLRVGLTVVYCVLPLLAAVLAVIGGLALVPDMVLSEVAPRVTRWSATRSVTVVVLMATLVLTDVAAYLGAQPFERRLRHTEETAGSAGRRFARALVIGFLPLTAWLIFIETTPGAGPVARFGGLLVFLLAVNALGPLLVTSAQETFRIEEPLRQRLVGLCRAQGLQVRDVRGIRSRSSRVANAMITGVLPSLRYVLITDYLLDNLDDDELEAIVAHEIGHGRQHHLLAKTGAWLGLIVVWAVAVAVLPGALGVVPLVLFLGLFVVHGRVGVLLEQKADDYACEQVGTEAVVRALEKLAALNMLKRRTGRLWDALQQHPGIERRIARLQQRVAPAGRPS
jgi:STE24 endopeptidase